MLVGSSPGGVYLEDDSAKKGTEEVKCHRAGVVSRQSFGKGKKSEVKKVSGTVSETRETRVRVRFLDRLALAGFPRSDSGAVGAQCRTSGGQAPQKGCRKCTLIRLSRLFDLVKSASWIVPRALPSLDLLP